MKKSTNLLLMLTCVSALALTSCKKEGCTDATATNYNSKAKKDDGSCIAKVTPSAPSFSAKVDGVSFSGTLSTSTINNKLIIQSNLGNKNIAIEMPKGIGVGTFSFENPFAGLKTALYNDGNSLYGAEAGSGTLIITSNTAATVSTPARIIGSFTFTASPYLMSTGTNSYAISNGQFNVTY